MAHNFSNRGQIVQTVLAGGALLVVGLTAYSAHLGTVPASLWLFLFSFTIASMGVAILNLWVGWSRTGSDPTNKVEIISSATKLSPSELQSAGELPQQIVTVKIAFAYLPKSPLENGWTVGYRTEEAHPSFSAIRANFETTLSMVVGERFAMDHEIPRNAQFSRRIVFSVIYHQNTMLFLQFKLKAEDGRTTSDLWVKIEPGTLPPERTPNYPTEYTIRVQGSTQSDGWMLMDMNLPEIIERTWLNEGWHYEAVLRIRLRGSVGVSPISLFA